MAEVEGRRGGGAGGAARACGGAWGRAYVEEAGGSVDVRRAARAVCTGGAVCTGSSFFSARAAGVRARRRGRRGHQRRGRGWAA